eukprot:190945-Chlamydomonas_euryale.AAC.13
MFFRLGVHWGFSASALCLGASYYQRALRPTLAEWRALAGCAAGCACGEGGGSASAAAQGMPAATAPPRPRPPPHQAEPAWPMLAKLFACVVLASKVEGQLPHPYVLPRILSRLSGEHVGVHEASMVSRLGGGYAVNAGPGGGDETRGAVYLACQLSASYTKPARWYGWGGVPHAWCGQRHDAERHSACMVRAAP